MKKYYTIKEWIEINPGFSYGEVRRWVAAGMNHISKKPIKFSQEDVDTFLETYKTQCRIQKMEKMKKTHERIKPIRIMSHYNKIDENFIYSK